MARAPENTPTSKDDGNEDDATAFDDEQTDRAIDDIVASEGDALLAAQDGKAPKAEAISPRHRTNIFARWWRHKLARWLTLVVIVGGMGAAASLPVARYWILNAAGARVSASLQAVDDKTGLQLRGVTVTIGGTSVDTDNDGLAKLTGLRLGPQTLHIEQTGFGVIDQKVVLGWGSNPLGRYKLQAAGVRYTIEVRDFLTEKPIAGAEASSGDATALSDKNGKIELALADAADIANPVTITKDGYRNEVINLGSDPKVATKVTLLTSQKTVFISHQSGRYDVYKSDLDGKNATVLLAGTGSETNNLSLVMGPDGTKAALVSTRDNQLDSDGFLLSTLAVINIADGTVTIVTRAAQIQLIDWIGNRLIFEQVSSDPNVAASARNSIVGYSVDDKSRVQLVAAKKLNTVFSAQGAIYYAVATDGSTTGAFYKVNPDGSGKQQAIDKEIWSGQRVDYNTFNLQTADDGWLAYDLPSGKATAISSPTSYTNRLYSDSATKTKSLWVDSSSGQGVLKLYDLQSGKDKTVVTQNGLTNPLYWLGDSVAVYRVVTGGEIADYAVSLQGGTPNKISDVSNSYGFTAGQ